MPTHAHYLGGFYYSWSSFELILEVLCRDELVIDDHRAHITLSSLSAAAKQEIAINLVSISTRANRDEIIKCIRRIPNIARRNHITHSLLAANAAMTEFTFFKREIASGSLVARKLVFSGVEMQDHFKTLNDALVDLQHLIGLTDADLESYCEAIKAFVK